VIEQNTTRVNHVKTRVFKPVYGLFIPKTVESILVLSLFWM